MRRYLDIEMLLIPFFFVLMLAFLAPTRIGFLGGPLLAPLLMVFMSVPLSVRALDESRRQYWLRYILTNLAATGAVCIFIWSVRSAILALTGE